MEGMILSSPIYFYNVFFDTSSELKQDDISPPKYVAYILDWGKLYFCILNKVLNIQLKPPL